MELRPAKKLGFGLMRLPVLSDERTIDIPQLCHMVDEFMNRGFTYFDTAYVYHSGMSEVAFKEAVVDRYPRDSFTIATKLPAWELKKQDDVKRIFDESLDRAGIDYYDYYLLHSVETEHIPTYEKYDCWNFCKQMKAEGKIKHFGFSFHDKAEVLDKVLTDHPEAEFVQIQLNYLDWENNLVQSRQCYEVATKHGIPVIVMEPVKGGTLANIPDDIAEIYKKANPDASIPSWALRFAGSLENVMVVLSGMSNEAQMMDNLGTMDNMKVLDESETTTIKQVTDKLLAMPTVPCTGCRYCVDGCPMGIKIPDVFTCLNNVRLYGPNNRADNFYKSFTENAGLASACVQCGQCEGVCPQHLEIIEILKEVSATFEG